MKKIILPGLMFLLVIQFVTGNALAQLSGTKTIDNLFPTAGSNYNSFTDAINNLNSSGVGAGGVTFEVSSNQTFNELPPVLNATGTLNNPIVFIKNGAGNNPLITPNIPGILSTTTFGNNADGIVIINGGDYITFNGIDLNANSDSTAGNIEKYEYGYFLKKSSGTDACKNVSIINSTIALQQNIGTVVSVGCGIYVSNISGTSSVTVTSAGGVSENINISSNTLMTCMMGIQVRGFNATTFRDLNIQIGVQGENKIIDFGGTISITTYGIYCIFQENLKIANNIVTSKVTTGFAFQGITTETGTNSNLEVYANRVTLKGSSTFYAIRNTMGSSGTNNSVRIYDNVLAENESTTGSTGDIHLINNSGAPHKLYINSNQLGNNIHNGTGTLFGINQTGNVVDSIKIFDNNITDNLKTSGTTPFRGIQNTATAGSKTAIYNNTITGNNDQSAGGIIYCINHSSGNTAVIHNNRVYNNTSMLGQIRGIVSGLSSGNSQTIFNNFISELYTPNGDGTISGIEITGSGTHRLYYNTIFLNASSTAPTFENSGIYYNSTSGSCDLRNNLVVNLSQAGSDAAAFAVAFRKSSTTLTNYASGSNNNNFYAGTPGPKNLIYHDGTDGDQTIGLYKSRVAPRDNNSFTELSPFINTNSSPYDLRLNPNIPSGCESGGLVISSPIAITTDYFGEARYPNAGYPVKSGFPPTAPDVGADEYGGEPVDLVEPYIAYSPLGPTSSLSNRILTASISDQAGIAGGLSSPRLYYKKVTDMNYIFDNNPVQSGNDYTFTFNYASLGGVSYDDRIVYYVAAQDINDNLSSVPGGATGINPPGTVPTPNPNFYDVYDPAPMSGTYLIGYETFKSFSGIDLKFEKIIKEVRNEYDELHSLVENVPMVNGKKYNDNLYYEFSQRDKLENGRGINGVFPNFYAVILNLNIRGISGPVTFLLNDATYDSETFPLVFDPVTGSSASNTITIKPNTGVNSVITGSSTNSIIKFNGADNFIIDGSNETDGLSRNLTITNTIAGTNSAVIWLSSLGAGAGSMNNTIMNCNLSAGVDMSIATTSTYGIVSSGTTASTQVSINDGDGNDNNSIINNYITKCRYGIHLQGIAASLNSNVVISGNEIGPDEFGSESIGLCGIVTLRQTGISITDNTIKYIGGTFATTSGGGTRIGIGLGNNSITGTSVINNAVVSGNLIYEIRDERNGNAAAIMIGASGGSTNNSVYNNVIHTILANTNSTANRCIGIGIVAGDNDRVLFNSIRMTGDLDPPGASLPVLQNAAGIRVTSATAVTNLTLMNNIVSVDLTSDNTDIRHFSIIVPTSTFNWGTGASNYNDYYFNSSNAQMSMGGFGLANASMTAVPNLNDWRNLFSQQQDKQSMSRDPGFTSNTNLQPDPLNTNSWNISGMGQIFSNIDKDKNGSERSTDRKNGTVDLGAFEFLPDLSTISPSVFLTEEIAVGRVQEMFFADRKVGEIEWVSGNALPSDLSVLFRAGTTPPSRSSAPQISNSFWTAEQTGGTDFVYNLRLDYDINQIGNIPYESDIRTAKLDAGNWVVYGSSIVDSNANTVSVSNLSSFSDFALSTSKLSLTIEVIPQGFYNTGTGRMNSKDTLRAYLRNTLSPFAVVDSSIAVIDSVTFTASFDFMNAAAGTYYVMVDHRNSINTWSKSGGEDISSFIQNNFDFTASASQAFGNNQVLVNPKYCIYSGDVNKDGFIDLTDVIEISNDAAAFVTGYVNTDVNGDYITDLTDQAITYNNSVNLVSEVGP